ncbi:hypothetical protein SAMN05192576_2480 [Nocardioides szechwanensis]|uniref:Uncharacterized protein n=1 Tax=Nocardioides szechwanensis TaxID=1005944 RepID=A0A1H0CNR9_9ACTN|nr:hypothetical protein [Nocardioides szechwanensis]SDN59485.1 hypothetical protein SAMN05192576_2480 [Nocardioides szechwanensis]
MYGDTDALRRRADQLREQGVDIRALAHRLVSQTENLGWTGRAAESMRLRIRERAAHLRGAAGEHEAAANSLDRHVQEVGRLQDTIADREHRATSLVAEARTRVAQVEAANEGADAAVRRVADPDDLVLAAFTPPTSGHKDWLAVDLPGLREDTSDS